MEPKDRIIVALDVATAAEASQLIGALAPHVGMFKVGLEFITAVGAKYAVELVRGYNGRVFFDGKFMDIPNTVAGAARAVTQLGVWAFNVHCLGGEAMMRAAREAAEKTAAERNIPRPLVLGVTILTSLNDLDFRTMGIEARCGPDDIELKLAERDHTDVEVVVARLAQLSGACRLDGVIASPHEIAVIRKACGPEFLIVTPGVRPTWAEAQDQKRVMTPGDAIRAGADYLVIGRPITKPPAEIGSPAAAAQKIADEIAEALAQREKGRTP